MPNNQNEFRLQSPTWSCTEVEFQPHKHLADIGPLFQVGDRISVLFFIVYIIHTVLPYYYALSILFWPYFRIITIHCIYYLDRISVLLFMTYIIYTVFPYYFELYILLSYFRISDLPFIICISYTVFPYNHLLYILYYISVSPYYYLLLY